MKGINVERAINPFPKSIVITGIPLPPSSNSQYSSFVRGGKVRRVSSPEAVNYKKVFDRWGLVNRQKIEGIKRTIRMWDAALICDMYCVFEKERLVTKEGRLKKLDASNRIKSLHDLMADLLNLDDSVFTIISVEKVLGVAKSEQVIMVLKPSILRSIIDVTSDLAEEGVL